MLLKSKLKNNSEHEQEEKPSVKLPFFGRKKQDRQNGFKKSKKLTPKRIIIMVLIVAIIGSGGYGVFRLFFYEEPKQMITGTTTKGSLTTLIEGSATTTPTSFQKLTIPADGTVSKIYVSQGDKVAVGDALYTMDTTDLNAEIAELEATISDYEADLSDCYQNIADLSVKAPFDGKILDVKIEEGSKISANGTVATLVDDSKMLLSLYFSYAYKDSIYEGMSASVSVPDYMTALEGTVTSIDWVSYVSSEGASCFKVNISVNNPGSLTADLSASATLYSDGAEISPAESGTLKYNKTKTISTEVSGTVSSLKVQNYSRVSSGDTLAVILNDDYAKQVTSLEKKIASSKASLTEKQETLADCSPKATVAGTVIYVRIKEGDEVTKSSAAMAIYNTDTMEISADINESENEYISLGMEVSIAKSGSSGKTYTGTVTETSLEATSSNGVAYFPVTITIPSKGELSAGINVTYSITAAQASDVILAPIAALKNTKYGTCLFIKADSKPEDAVDLDEGVVPDGYYAVKVETGLSDESNVEIKSGVSEGVTVFEQYISTSSTAGSDTTSENSESATTQQQMPQGMPGGMPGGSSSGGMGGPRS